MIKLEKFLFYIFLFLIPFQIRYFLHWGENEWNSVFVYLGDVVFFVVVVLWIVHQKRIGPIRLISPIGPIGLFLLIAGISLFFAGNLGVGVFRFVKLVEFGLLFVYLTHKSNRTYNTYKTYMVLIAAGLLQSVLAIAQFIKQSSLGLKFVEAGTFIPGVPGVASFVMDGEKIMRAYASFPHPNVLAGFLLLSIFCLYVLQLRSQYPNYIRIVRIPIFFLLVFGLFLTFSRTAIGVFLVMSLVMFLVYLMRSQSTNNIRIIRMQTVKLFAVFLLSVIISTAILFPYLKSRFFGISFEEQAVDLRFFYNKMAFAMIKEKPLLGIGIGNFVHYSQNYEAYLRAASKMLDLETIPQWLYQPVHNIYLLIGAEIGILGLIVFIAILITNCIRMIRKVNPFFFLFIAFLLLGLTDHYFWTLQSGGLIFWLALVLARIENPNDKIQMSNEIQNPNVKLF